MITASVTHEGRAFSVRIANGEAFDLVARGSDGAVLWKARLSTPYYCVGEASIHALPGGGVEVRATGAHVKDDSVREHVWRYSRDGALVSGP
ncbi:MAG: hypothetical protein J0L92_10640 [Deltaproteobacteria bacterium]|nr:hypothetical protein [Deltaproteobacteria bacterium]